MNEENIPIESISLNNRIKILSNPFYCITIDPIFCEKHPPIISEEDFIKSGSKMILEFGAETYLKTLLENLKGNYISDYENPESILGYKRVNSRI